jgi:Mrp family chromosome partitioning ATPase
MERIQSAIAKARADRQAIVRAGGDTAAAPVAPPPVQSPLPSAPQAAPDAAQVAARWQALAEVRPDPRRLERAHIVTVAGGREATAFDVMRTRMLQQMRTNNWRRIAIVSPMPACGKSTVALNLAFSLARQPGLRCILAEVDLRRPTLTGMTGLPDHMAFPHVLDGTAPFAEEARRVGQNLALAFSFRPARDPSERLQAPTVGPALQKIADDYAPDVMLFDTSPLMVADDTMAFLGHVDAALLIAAAEATTIKQIDQCEREIAGQTNVMGVVLNKCRYMGEDQGYDYY